MSSLRGILEEINSNITPSNTRVKRRPLDEVLQEVHHKLALQIEPSHPECKHIQFGVTHEALEQWIRLISLTPVQSVNGESVFEIDEGIGKSAIPIVENLGIKDNLRLLLRYIDFYLNNYYMSVFRESSRSQCPISEQYASTGRQATTTGLAYHLLILETITEGFSIDLESLNQDNFEKRKKSGYNVLSDISSNIENLTLVFLDNIATVEMLNPFYLDKSTDEVKMKREVLEILRITTQLYHSMKVPSPDTLELFQKLQELCNTYSPQHELFHLLMDSITSGIENGNGELHGCPAHGIKNNNGVSIFRELFDFSISSFGNHYTTLRKKGLRNPETNILTSDNETHLYGAEIKKVLEETAKIGSIIGTMKSKSVTS